MRLAAMASAAIAVGLALTAFGQTATPKPTVMYGKVVSVDAAAGRFPLFAPVSFIFEDAVQ